MTVAGRCQPCAAGQTVQAWYPIVQQPLELLLGPGNAHQIESLDQA